MRELRRLEAVSVSLRHAWGCPSHVSPEFSKSYRLRALLVVIEAPERSQRLGGRSDDDWLAFYGSEVLAQAHHPGSHRLGGPEVEKHDVIVAMMNDAV